MFNYLIDVQELVALKPTSSLKILDFRSPDAYACEHIEGAIHIWRDDIEDHSFPYKGMMVEKEQLEQLFSQMGITNDDQLILYNDNGSCDTTRLWWVLQNYDFLNIRILNGGFKFWKAINNATTAEVPEYPKTVFKLPEVPSFRSLITKGEIIQRMNANDATVFIDTRTADEYSGKCRKKDAMEGGRIPNNTSIN